MAILELSATTLIDDANLVQYHKLEDVTKTVGNDFTNYGSVDFVAANFNNGSRRDAAGEYLSHATALSYAQFGAAWTFMGMVRIDTLPTTEATDRHSFFSTRNTDGSSSRFIQMFYEGRTANGVGWGYEPYNGTAVTAIATANQSQWYYIAITYDGTNIRFYIDGSKIATNAHTYGAWANSTAGYYQLHRNGTNDNALVCVLDDWATFSRCLSDTEISNHASGADATGGAATGNFFLMFN